VFFVVFLSYIFEIFRITSPQNTELKIVEMKRIKNFFGDDLTSHEISDHSIHHLKYNIQTTATWRRRESQFKISFSSSSTHQ
jgi:hypothetical protein